MTIAHQAPLPMVFSRQEYWSELPCPPPGDHPDSGTKSRSPALQADSLWSELPWKPLIQYPFIPFLTLILVASHKVYKLSIAY